MMTEHDNIVAKAFNEESADIPNATPAEGHGTTGGKETHTQSKPQPTQPVTATITRGKEQHTVNFNFTNKEQHREKLPTRRTATAQQHGSNNESGDHRNRSP